MADNIPSWKRETKKNSPLRISRHLALIRLPIKSSIRYRQKQKKAFAAATLIPRPFPLPVKNRPLILKTTLLFSDVADRQLRR